MTTLFNFFGLQVRTTPAGERDFHIFQYVQPTSEVHSTFHLMGARDSFFRKKRSECEADIHLHLVQRLGINDAATTLSLYVFVACAGAILPLPLGLDP